MLRINFVEEKKTVEVKEGTTILEASKQAGLIIESPCSGTGTCGKCRVKIHGSRNVACDESLYRLSDSEKAQNYVLACQARVYGDIYVATEEKNRNATLKILTEGYSFDYGIQPNIAKKFDGSRTAVYIGNEVSGYEPGDTSEYIYGLAVDIGTTTLVVSLIDLNTGKKLAEASSLNPQSIHAQDVLTRIKYASVPEGLREMYSEVTAEINRLCLETEKKALTDARYVYEAVYSGNTTMVHLACGVNPESLGKYPYVPKMLGGNLLDAKGLPVSAMAKIYIPPVISAYVGPDITSGILASGLGNEAGVTLFIDVGTNGEMAISKDGLLSATSTAAGPAFEGMNISCGMRAGAGAVEEFYVSPEDGVVIKTIGNSEPVGICGSGLLDIAGVLVNEGVISKSGKFVFPENGNYNELLKRRMLKREGKVCFFLTENVFLTQKDIRQVQLAKGAVRAGVEALLDSKGITAQDVDRVQIAGSFGYHLREENLVRIGMLPKEFGGKITFLGNTSKTGAEAFLLNRSFRDCIKEKVGAIEVIELANKENFDKLFVSALSF